MIGGFAPGEYNPNGPRPLADPTRTPVESECACARKRRLMMAAIVLLILYILFRR